MNANMPDNNCRIKTELAYECHRLFKMLLYNIQVLSQINLKNERYALQAQVNQGRPQDELVTLYGNRNLANTSLQNIAVLLCMPRFGQFTSSMPRNTAFFLPLCVQTLQRQYVDQEIMIGMTCV